MFLSTDCVLNVAEFIDSNESFENLKTLNHLMILNKSLYEHSWWKKILSKSYICFKRDWKYLNVNFKPISKLCVSSDSFETEDDFNFLRKIPSSVELKIILSIDWLQNSNTNIDNLFCFNVTFLCTINRSFQRFHFFNDCQEPWKGNIFLLNSNANQLKHLVINSTTCLKNNHKSNDLIQNLRYMPNLEELAVYDGILHGHLKYLSKLKTLQISKFIERGSFWYTDRDHKYFNFKNIQTIENLYLDNVYFDNFDDFNKCTQLKTLYLSFGQRNYSPVPQLVDVLNAVKTLEYLCFDEILVQDASSIINEIEQLGNKSTLHWEFEEFDGYFSMKIAYYKGWFRKDDDEGNDEKKRKKFKYYK